MNKYFSIMFAFIVLTTSGCAENYQAANSARDMQRDHAEKAQEELSAAVAK